MAASARALINPKLITWARESAGMDLEETASRLRSLRITADKLRSWEEGTARPTVKQLRRIATVCRQSFAAFYLPEPPAVFRPPLRDYRRLPDSGYAGFSSDLTLDVRMSVDRRNICLDLYAELSESPPSFEAQATLQDGPAGVSRVIRDLLGVDEKQQKSWRDNRIAFNSWREAIEACGVLVFQATGIELSSMRGYSIAEFPLPVIVTNRKDAYAGRIFTMFHELVHLMLRTSGVCDPYSDANRPPEEQRTEVFCNRVAGATLVPEAWLLNEPTVRGHRDPVWADAELDSLSGLYRVSTEVIVRRLLRLGLTNEEFYRSKRAQYQRQYSSWPRSEARISPSRDLVSAAGKPYVSLVLGAYDTHRITVSDVSDYFGVKLKHVDGIREAIRPR